MAASLLDGVRIVNLGGAPTAMAARILSDLGAVVVGVDPPDGPDSGGGAWHRGTIRMREVTDDVFELADVVLDTPGWPGAPVADPRQAPEAVWVRVTPFGLDGPRSRWRASDLGIMAASGNMHATGDPDRPPVRCTAPTSFAHTGPEVAFAVLTGLATGRPQRIDVSMQEVVCAANMCAPAREVHSGERFRRRGANIGRTREIWPCQDGWVSFGLRGGKARAPSLETLTRLCVEAGVATPALTDADWSTWLHTEASPEELEAIAGPIGEFFARHTMRELYELACETNLMLAPVNSPGEIYASAQLAAREFFDGDGFPQSWAQVVSADADVAAIRPHEHAVNALLAHRSRDRPSRRRVDHGAWRGTKIVELGSGAAGPIATRFFVEHGATVVRIESRSRPDFLRVYALGPDNPHGLEGSVMFDGMNLGKLSITLDLKHPDGVAVARSLFAWADAVCENFAPRAMKGFGLDYRSLVDEQPDLVMVSSCLNGQTGPHKDYPGFGGQGAALSGYNFLTGWPDREPVGPFGTITDSLAPRFMATALAAGLHYRRRTGRGVHLDVSQVETAAWTLAPWLLDYHRTGQVTERMGNRSPDAVPHGAFPCAGDDRWVAVACWTDEEWARLAQIVGVDDPALARFEERARRVDDVEAAVTAWTSSRDRDDVAALLQAEGIEAVPVQDFADLLADPQLAHRGHFTTLEHPRMGPGPYERCGFRLSEAAAGYDRPGPLLGEHTEMVLGGLLGLPEREIHRLQAAGALD